jgi:hypothetical protein
LLWLNFNPVVHLQPMARGLICSAVTKSGQRQLQSSDHLHPSGRLLVGINDGNFMVMQSKSTRWWAGSGRRMVGSGKPASWQHHHIKISARCHLFSC